MSYNLSRQVKSKLAEGDSPAPAARVRPAQPGGATPDLKALLAPVIEEMVDDRLFNVLTNLGQRPHFLHAKTANGGKWTVMDSKEDSARLVFHVEGDDVSVAIMPDSLTAKSMGTGERPRARLGAASDLAGLRARLEAEVVGYAIEKIRMDHKRLTRGRCQSRDRPYLEQICEVLEVAAPYYG